MSFNTQLNPHYRNFDGYRFPNIDKPYIVGHFSVDKNRQYKSDASNCKYLQMPQQKPLNLDLNDGYEIAVSKPEIDEKINHLLTFIQSNLPKLRNVDPNSCDTKALKPDIVCFRGLLRLIMCTPYESQEGWSILATKFRGTIYLCARETIDAKEKRLRMTEQSKRFCSYGFKFEQYILTANYGEPPDTSLPVVEAEEFCCMFSTKLNGIRLMYGAEMDGVRQTSEVAFDRCTADDWNSLEFVEVKVTADNLNYRQQQNFLKFKVRNWWCQSFLVGIREIVVGKRTHSGTVTSIDRVFVSDIPKMAAVSSRQCHKCFCAAAAEYLKFHLFVNVEFMVTGRVLRVLQQISENDPNPDEWHRLPEDGI